MNKSHMRYHKIPKTYNIKIGNPILSPTPTQCQSTNQATSKIAPLPPNPSTVYGFITRLQLPIQQQSPHTNHNMPKISSNPNHNTKNNTKNNTRHNKRHNKRHNTRLHWTTRTPRRCWKETRSSKRHKYPTLSSRRIGSWRMGVMPVWCSGRIKAMPS